jgi:hypothetical protein
MSSFKLFDKYGVENCAIELIQLYPCDNRTELEKLEGKFIKENIEYCINICIAGRTKKQYYIDKTDKIKQYQIDNADKIKEQKKQYKIDNIDKIKEQQKQYKINNIDKIKDKYNCNCGGKYTYSAKSRHCKTKKHLEYLEQQTITNNNHCNITINNTKNNIESIIPIKKKNSINTIESIMPIKLKNKKNNIIKIIKINSMKKLYVNVEQNIIRKVKGNIKKLINIKNI